ncbi:Uncharacterized protein OBRU01_02247, partial [Operophtera brumata]
MTPVDHQTQAVDLQITRAGQVATDSTEMTRRMNQTGHSLMPTSRAQHRPVQESRQMQADNLTTRRPLQTVDLTARQNQTPTEHRQILTGLIWMNSQIRQIQHLVGNLTTDLTGPTIGQISTDPTEVQRISTVDGPMLSTSTASLQNQTENLRTRRQFQTVDLTGQSISQITVPTDVRQISTEVRQILTVDAPMLPNPTELIERAPQAGQTSTGTTEIGQRVNGTDLNPPLLLPTAMLQRHPVQQGHQIQTENLTTTHRQIPTVDLTTSPTSLMPGARQRPTVDRQISMNPADSNHQAASERPRHRGCILRRVRAMLRVRRPRPLGPRLPLQITMADPLC